MIEPVKDETMSRMITMLENALAENRRHQERFEKYKGEVRDFSALRYRLRQEEVKVAQLGKENERLEKLLEDIVKKLEAAS